MSLKAKLEAVIYAAEEPVTLTQLAALFSADALEWKAQSQAAAAEDAAEAAAGESAEALPLLQQGLENIGFTTDEAEEPDTELPLEAPTEMATADQAVGDGSQGQAGAEELAEAAGNPGGDAEAQVSAEADAQADAALEARREARQREREVKAILKQILDELVAEYEPDSRGIEIREIAGGYRMATKPECHDAVRMFVKSLKPPLKLSLPALETLAVVAYKQPATAPEVSEIRGVESGGVLGSLLARKLIATAGRKQVIGRPILYKTTKEFLMRFGLNDLNELPSMDEFEKMAVADIDEVDAADAAENAVAQQALAEAEAAEPDTLLDSPILDLSTPPGQDALPGNRAGEAATAPTPIQINAEQQEQFASNSPGGQELAESAEPLQEPAAAKDSAQPSNEPEAEATAATEYASPAADTSAAAEIEAILDAKEAEEPR